MTGKVILVGAGPGDPGLLTRKGLAALERADVVVYDRLVSPAILARIPARAEKIDVGKQPDRHPVPQHEIDRILLHKALEGHYVVRLKGGDPFLFGRGGEELELLAEHGVPFEVVPGVTSALAAPSYGGIPVTHRDFASSLHIVTGHRRSGTELAIDFEALVRAGGTLVFLMGVAALKEITQGLLQAGMDPDTPAAMVERGSTPQQRRLSATLATLAHRAQEERIQNPAVIVVGEVCSLAQRFDWFDQLPLKGQSIIVTRPEDRAGALSDKLRALGADVMEYPCIRTTPIVPCAGLDEAIAHIGNYQWLAFTSPAGVETLWAWLDSQGLDVRALGNSKLAALGPGTAKALKNHGLRADLMPAVYDAEHLGQALAATATGAVLMLRAQEASPALPAALDQAGIPYDDIAIYRTEFCDHWKEPVKSAVANGVKFVSFTSASTVKAFVALAEGVDLTQITGICIGEQTADEAKKHGIPTIVAKSATIDALVDAFAEAVKE